jgi:hypothetical protein
MIVLGIDFSKTVTRLLPPDKSGLAMTEEII